MHTNNIEFLSQRFGANISNVGNITELKDFFNLSAEEQTEYKRTCLMYPEWNHTQIMCRIRILVEITNYENGIII